MAASALSYDNVMVGASDPSPGRVVLLGRHYQLPQGVYYHSNINGLFYTNHRQ